MVGVGEIIMARGINKVILIGNLGQDPEVRYMPNGGAVTNITVATSETWRDKNSGNQQERTEWHRVVFFNRLAEIAGEYLRKGSKVYIEGSLRTRKWQAQDGSDRYTTEIVCSEMQMLDGQNNSGQPYTQQPPSNHQPTTDARYNPNGTKKSAYTQPQPQQTPAPASNGPEPFDDDIPFAPYMRAAELMV